MSHQIVLSINLIFALFMAYKKIPSKGNTKKIIEHEAFIDFMKIICPEFKINNEMDKINSIKTMVSNFKNGSKLIYDFGISKEDINNFLKLSNNNKILLMGNFIDNFLNTQKINELCENLIKILLSSVNTKDNKNANFDNHKNTCVEMILLKVIILSLEASDNKDKIINT